MRTSHEKGTRMKYSFIRLTMAVAAAAIISPVQAQIASPTAAPPPWPPAAYPGGSFPYAFPAPTPEDAYQGRVDKPLELRTARRTAAIGDARAEP